MYYFKSMFMIFLIFCHQIIMLYNISIRNVIQNNINLLLNALKIFDTSKKGVIEKVEC